MSLVKNPDARANKYLLARIDKALYAVEVF